MSGGKTRIHLIEGKIREQLALKAEKLGIVDKVEIRSVNFTFRNRHIIRLLAKRG